MLIPEQSTISFFSKAPFLYALNTFSGHIFFVLKRFFSYFLCSFHFYFKDLLYFLMSHYELLFKFFIDLIVVDFPSNFLRFLSIYNITSLNYNAKLLLKVFIPTNLLITTVTDLFPCSSWFERESWDLFGIFYYSNLDLRRILNDYGFNGHPLKKDFPLSGFVEIVFVIFFSLVCYDSIKLNQEFRFFHISSPWKFL